MKPIRVTIWNEYHHEKVEEHVKAIFPEGLHAYLKSVLECDDIQITTASLDMPGQGLPDEVLNNTDVLMWWGHVLHHLVDDALVEKIKHRVYDCGMGFIGLHSAHMSKPFRALVGTSGNLLWGDEQQEIVWNILPAHPIAAGIPEHFELELEEMYGEPFMIPQPDELVFASWFRHGNIFRSGCCFYRGMGKIFYFQPGHESCRSFFNPNVQRILKNAIRWAAPNEFNNRYPSSCDYYEKLVK